MENRSSRVTRTGIVIKRSGEKTISVLVEDLKQHPKYKKTYKVSKKYSAHIEDDNSVSSGDSVEITSCRPISKSKRWRVSSVIGNEGK